MELELKINKTRLSFKRDLEDRVWLNRDVTDLAKVFKLACEFANINPSFVASHLKYLCDEEDKK